MKPQSIRAVVFFTLGSAAAPALGQQYRPVDDATLRQPPAGEWLTYGLSYAETRFSPLDQIDTRNIQHLQLAWTWDIPAGQAAGGEGPGSIGQIEGTPLVSNGVMYATGSWNIVFALDARTGALKWKWDPAIVRGGRAAGGPTVSNGSPNRGVALYDGKVYMGLLDGRLVALDAETGDPMWVRQTTPYGGDSEYIITGAPRVVDGKVIIGNSGAEFHGVRGYITAYDARTGEQVWRFYTVPGDPSMPFESPAMEMAAETWAGEWWKYGGGGTAWDNFSFDPEAKLLYIGTGNGSPWSRYHRSAGRGDNLFLNCIVAVNVDTGELVWYYQTVPGDDWDYTSTMTMTLADLVIDGRERKVLMQAPKNGFFYVLDRLTGELISAEKITEHVTWASDIDMVTGRPIETPNARYDDVPDGVWLSPGPAAAHNWHPMSYNPMTGLVYIPGQNTRQFYSLDREYVPRLGRFSTGLERGPPSIEPPPPPEPLGFLLARDPVTQQDRWRIEYDSPGNGGTLTTAGNLVFSGRRDGVLLAYNAATGEQLAELAIAPRPVSPITYELGARQYVSILTGPAQGITGSSGRVWTFTLDEAEQQ